MFNKFELIGAGVSVLFMAMAVYLMQTNNGLIRVNETQKASVSNSIDAGIVIVQPDEDVNGARTEAYLEAADFKGNIKRMVIDDIKIGTGEEVKKGDKVAVHYVGTLQNGQEFDNSKKRGSTFEFTVGAGQVIKGWDEGLIGMKTGGERILVIPPEMAYGEQGIGPIPGGATLIFAIELVEIK